MASRDPRHLIHKGLKTPAPTSTACAAWAFLLPEAADGLLSEAEQHALDRHLAVCPACMAEFTEAQRGLAWLTVLKEQTPQPPSNLLSNILAQTTGMAEAGVTLPELSYPLPEMAYVQPAVPAPTVWEALGPLSWTERLQQVWADLMQPRMAMTAAMAFFSICLTLNLLGVSVAQLDSQALRAGELHRTVADTGASIVRSIQGIRLVYRVESRVTEMRAQMDSPASQTTAH